MMMPELFDGGQKITHTFDDPQKVVILINK
jgi:hypothetical protein